VDVRPFGLESRSRSFADGLDGPARESANDEELLAAGIHPGHQSLYPKSLADVFPSEHAHAPHEGSDAPRATDPVSQAR
jgi:hypothetical protein